MPSFFFYRANRKFMMKGMMAIALSVCFYSLGVAAPTEARLSAVEKCQFLGKVEGSSGYGKNSGWQSLAKYSALHHAEKLGASHVVWEQMFPVGAFNGTITARAYSCS